MRRDAVAANAVFDPTSLIQRWCRDGDSEAFRRFYREQSPKLWKFLVARGCEREAAYDLVAEAFLRFVRTVCRDPQSPVALLYRIATNLRIDAYRREQASPVDSAREPDNAQTSVFPEPDEYADVRALISGLPEREQNLLLMRYWIGLSHKEVAAALGVPEGTVRRQCAELLSRLHDRLKDDE